MDELKKIKRQSKNLAKVMVAEFGYCSILYFIYKAFIKQTALTNWIYIALLIILPLAFNIFLYIKSKKQSIMIESNNIIIVQILILFFSLKILIK